MRSTNNISNIQHLLHFFDSLIADGYIITILGVKHVLKLSSDLCQKFILYYFQQRKDQLRPIYLVQGFNKFKTEYMCSIFHEMDALRMLRESNYKVNIYGVHSNKNMANLSALWKKELEEIHKTYQKDVRGQPIIPKFSNMLLTDVKAKIDEYCPNSRYQFPHTMYIAEGNVTQKEVEKEFNLEPSVRYVGTNENKNGGKGKNCNISRPGTQYIDMYFRRRIPEEEKIDAFQSTVSRESRHVAPQGMHQMVGKNYMNQMAHTNFTHQMMGANYIHNINGHHYGEKSEYTNWGGNISHLNHGMNGTRVNYETNVNNTNSENNNCENNNCEKNNFEKNNWKSFMSRMIQSTNAKVAENNMKDKKAFGKKRKPNSYAHAANNKRECSVEDVIKGNENKPKSGMKKKSGTVVVSVNNDGKEDEKKENHLPRGKAQNDKEQMKLDVSNNDLNMKMNYFDSSYSEKELTQKKISNKVVYTEEEAQEDQSVDMFFENGYFVVVDKSISENNQGPISEERKNMENAKENFPFGNNNKKHTQQTLLT
eukprot:XP_002259533.1 hypothetical protein, conserved in Plasmodium species [Plasmodium knowlesi strain H]